ncbi:hypothetical protein MJO29_007951 [Puccinia striiformis f. sp. tritici]|nr:hypothetical protein MJO29_007951 [Puccinia striiformis f. sp. tritici]
MKTTNQPSPVLSHFFQYPLPTNSSNLAINSNTCSVSLVKMPIHSKVLADHPLPLPKGNQEHTSIDQSKAGGPGKVEDDSIIGVNSEQKKIAKAKGKDSVTPAQKSGVGCHLDYQPFGDCFTHPLDYLSILGDQYANNLQVIGGQQKQKKDRIWISVDSVEPFVVPVTAGVTTFKQFHDLVASGCDKVEPNTAGIVLEAIKKKKLVLHWRGSITRVNDWKVSDKVNIDTEDKFNEWLMTTIEWKRFTMQLALFMPNPADQVKRGKKADILAKQAAHKLMLKESKSQKRQSANDNDSEPDDESEPEEIKPEDRDNVAFHKKNIYEKYKLKIDYDRYSPVFLDPGNDQRFKILTMAAAQECAMALVDRKDGVDMKSPPASPPWETLGKQRKTVSAQPPQEYSDSQTTRQVLRQLLADVVAEPTATLTEPQTAGNFTLTNVVAGRIVGTVPMVKYLEFLGIPDLHKVLGLLTKEDIVSHTLFRSPALVRKDVRNLGISLGTVTSLFNNVYLFDEYLASK